MKLGKVMPIHCDLFNLTSTMVTISTKKTLSKSPENFWKEQEWWWFGTYLFIVPISKSQLNQRPFIRVQMVFIGEVLHVRPQRNCKFLKLIKTGRIQNWVLRYIWRAKFDFTCMPKNLPSLVHQVVLHLYFFPALQY